MSAFSLRRDGREATKDAGLIRLSADDINWRIERVNGDVSRVYDDYSAEHRD